MNILQTLAAWRLSNSGANSVNISKSRFVKNGAVIGLAVLLTACATPSYLPHENQPSVSPIELSNIYVRGIFNWWEAEPAYRLSDDGRGNYAITIELIADGQPYDFRLSDEYWSPANSCGAKELKPFNQDEAVILYCGGDSRNLQFTPEVTGVYSFTVSQFESELRLVVTKQ